MAFPTNPIYKLIKNPDNKIDTVKKQIGNQVIVIPFSTDNTDYQEYLEWAKTNTPEEAD